ncbi:MAG: hypothetical protein ACI8VC_000087 [Candidatus Endobugula sp.]|jgi:hypothetical protein
MPTKDTSPHFPLVVAQNTISSFNGYSNSFQKIITISLSLLLLSCGQLPLKENGQQKETVGTNNIFHQDSTVYFTDKKSSVSLRASFLQKSIDTSSTAGSMASQSLINGYKLQVRTILPGTNVVDSASIIAGGKLILLTESELFLRSGKGLIISISSEDTFFINQQRDATLRFLFNGKSHLMSIRGHQINEFILPLPNTTQNPP